MYFIYIEITALVITYGLAIFFIFLALLYETLYTILRLNNKEALSVVEKTLDSIDKEN